jgi:hypothetical protein
MEPPYVGCYEVHGEGEDSVEVRSAVDHLNVTNKQQPGSSALLLQAFGAGQFESRVPLTLSLSRRERFLPNVISRIEPPLTVAADVRRL